jgi:hypothetical protein
VLVGSGPREIDDGLCDGDGDDDVNDEVTLKQLCVRINYDL